MVTDGRSDSFHDAAYDDDGVMLIVITNEACKTTTHMLSQPSSQSTKH